MIQEKEEKHKQRFTIFISPLQNDRTPLHSVARDGNVSVLKHLITKGADINAVSEVGCFFEARLNNLASFLINNRMRSKVS